ncbi:MAG: hypothetical protein IB618_04090 [Candidatus Pacearchaeota archaeon]|nr:MAG: hypothetical protein IB618_04090 [Candidatus Pacearchaeota archaeon]
MNKLEGILKLEELALPHGDWQIIKKASELNLNKKTKHGWCIRSCLPPEIKKDELALPFAAYVKTEEVSKIIEKFQKKFRGKGIFVVYPAWKFEKSGNLMLLENSIIIEAVEGFVRDLADGKKVDVYYKYPKYDDKIYICDVEVKGNRDLLSSLEITNLLDHARKIPYKNVVLEWSYDTDNNFYFHDIIEIKTL